LVVGISGRDIALSLFPQLLEFAGDAVLELVERGLYRKGLRVSRGGSEAPGES